MGRRCCCEEACECEHCAGRGRTCSCLKVVITGFPSEGGGDDPCPDGNCQNLNGTYFLVHDPESPCTWRTALGCDTSLICDESINEITLVISEDAGNYTATVTIGPYSWEKEYGTTRPTCRTFADESLSPVELGAGTFCDNESTTCLVTAKNIGGCTNISCSDVIDPPCCFGILVEGVVDDPLNATPECWACECFEETSGQLKKDSVGCFWTGMQFQLAGDPTCDKQRFTLRFVESGGVYTVRIVYDEISPVNPGGDEVVWEKSFDEEPDVSTWTNQVLSWVSGGDPHEDGCDFSSSTITLTPLYGNACSGLAGWFCTNCVDCGLGVPPDLEVEVFGVSNNGCDECTEFNDVFILEYLENVSGACRWRYVADEICGGANIDVRMTPFPGGLIRVIVLVDSLDVQFSHDISAGYELIDCNALDIDAIIVAGPRSSCFASAPDHATVKVA